MTTNFFSPLSLFLFWIRDPGWVKIRIRDKHPGPATLYSTIKYFWYQYQYSVLELLYFIYIYFPKTFA
jgi:hypothetical protein